MNHSRHLDWPFFEAHHRTLAIELHRWAVGFLVEETEDGVDKACRRFVRQLGADGWLKYAVGGTAFGGSSDTIDTRAICLIRETLAQQSGLADFAFSMQGLGSGAITLFGTLDQKKKYLPAVAKGEAIAAFALSELNAGSDVAAMQCEARRDGDSYVLSGDKTWISNGGIADFYVVFARTGEGEGSGGVSAFVVESGTPGFEVAERVEVSLHTLWRGWSSRTAASPATNVSERLVAGSKWPWPPSMFSALPSPPLP